MRLLGQCAGSQTVLHRYDAVQVHAYVGQIMGLSRMQTHCVPSRAYISAASQVRLRTPGIDYFTQQTENRHRFHLEPTWYEPRGRPRHQAANRPARQLGCLRFCGVVHVLHLGYTSHLPPRLVSTIDRHHPAPRSSFSATPVAKSGRCQSQATSQTHLA